jgi:hypothetical protein
MQTFVSTINDILMINENNIFMLKRSGTLVEINHVNDQRSDCDKGRKLYNMYLMSKPNDQSINKKTCYYDTY